MTLYKVTGPDGESIHGGTGKWRPGRWRTVSGELEPCYRGLHLCRTGDLVHWLGPVIWEAEYEGELVEADDKVVVRKARVTRRVETWNGRTARLFAAWCAEQALPYARPQDRDTLAETIRVVRAYADGQATDAELEAAGSAAWSAAGSAAGAAWSAAWSAARSAAWSAAGSAARSAAEAAAEAAWSAVEAATWSAAWSAAEAAAWSAAEAATRSAQTDHLLDLLGIER